MLRIAVLASHEGTTLQSIIDGCADGRINGRVVTVISNNSGSGALRRAAAAGIETFHFSSITHSSGNSLDTAICGALQRSGADVIFLAGYMKRLGPRTLAAFPARILNTHPALLPKFGGQGMFGDRVFEAVLADGESESGVSVHLVDAEYDAGAVCVRSASGFFREIPSTPSRSVCKRVSARSSSRRWRQLRVARWYSDVNQDISTRLGSLRMGRIPASRV